MPVAKKSGLMAAVESVSQKKVNATSTRGKKSDPRFRQVSLLVEKEPYNELRRRLIGTDQDASDVVNELIKGWVNRK
jgi:hypothetical protein